MELSKIKKLINSGYLTKIDELDKLVKMTEQEMVNNNYLTHIDIFDGDDTTDESEEIPEIDAPIVDDENTVGDDENTVGDDENTVVDDENTVVDDENISS